MDETVPLLGGRQQTTALVVLLWIVGLACYDAFAALAWGSEATISWTFALIGRRWPIVPFFLGAVLGHIFLVRWAPNWISWANLGTAAALVLGLAAGALLAAQQPPKPHVRPPPGRPEERPE